MATLKGQTVAASYQDLLKRADTYSQTGTNVELMDDSAVVKPTGLYLESGATTDNVGIGVAAPNEVLHVTSSSNPTIKIEAPSGQRPSLIFYAGDATEGQIVFQQSGSTKSYIQGGCVDNETIKFFTGGTTHAMTIDDSQNVGIGVAAPSTLVEIQGGLTTTGAVLTLSTKETSVVNGDVLGRINFQAPLDGAGTDSILPGASIHAEADDTFGVANNETDLVFSTATSDAELVSATSGAVFEHLRIHSSGYFDQRATTIFKVASFYRTDSYGASLNVGSPVGNITIGCKDNGIEYIGTDGTEWITFDSGSAGKAIMKGGVSESGGVLKENLLTNSGFDVWSNSTLVSAVTGAAPAAADAGDLSTSGSGSAWTGATSTTIPNGWTQYVAGIWTIDGSSGSGAEPALKITVNPGGDNNPAIYRYFTTVVGKLYKLSFKFKNGDATGGIVYFGNGTTNSNSLYNRWDPTDAGWTTYTQVIEATTTSTNLMIRCDHDDADKYCWYDEVMFHEVTPGCVAANNKAMDGWLKEDNTQCKLYRQHSDGDTEAVSKVGSFYSLKCVASADTYMQYEFPANSPQAARFAGRTVTFGMWVKGATAGDTRIYFYSEEGGSGVYSYSSYNAGTGWEWIELAKTCPDDLTRLQANIHIGTAGTHYYSQPMLVFGSSIGEGNYTRPQGEVVNLEQQALVGTSDALAATDDATLNLEALTSGKIPKGCKAISVNTSVKNSTMADDEGVGWGPDSDDWYDLRNYPVVSGVYNNIAGRIRCDSNGDIYRRVTESGATISYSAFYILAVELR